MSITTYGYIYKTTFPDDRYYIGQSKGNRVRPLYYGSGLFVLSFIKQYGKYGLKREVLSWVDGDQKALNSEEVLFLGDKYKTDHMCVNRGPGGNRGGATDEFREKMRLINTGKKLSHETRRKLSTLISGAGNSFYGRKHTEETKSKMRKPHRTYRGVPVER